MIHSYPWYIADWRGSEAVMAMTLEQRGLYRELLDHCWEAGSVPNSEVVLKKIAQVSEREWKRSWPIVKGQFTERDGRYYHRKVDEKRESLQDWHDSRREAGRKGGLKRWHGTNDSSANSSAIANVKPSSSSSSSTTTTKEETPKPPCSPDGERLPEAMDFALDPPRAAPVNGTFASYQGTWFEKWWAVYWRRVNRKNAEKAFRAHVKTLERFEEIMQATKAQTTTMMARDPDHRPHGATWLNAERWKDECSQPARAAPKPPGQAIAG